MSATLFPCPACGFEVFEEPVGSYAICPICSWEDDGVQFKFPDLIGGANGTCLFEWQQNNIEAIPLEVNEKTGFQRDPKWRPLTEMEARNKKDIPKTGLDYFNLVDVEIPEYYWRK